MQRGIKRGSKKPLKPTVMTSHNRMTLSSDPDAIVFESGLHAIVEIPARCPSKVCKREPELASQILIVASAATNYRTELSSAKPRRSKFYEHLAEDTDSSWRSTSRPGRTSRLRHLFCDRE